MYKYEITLYDKSEITATSTYPCALSLESALENKSEFITIGDVIVRKIDVKCIREVKDDE